MNSNFSLAKALGISPQELEEITTKNAARILAEEVQLAALMEEDLRSMTPERHRIINERLDRQLLLPPIMPVRGEGY